MTWHFKCLVSVLKALLSKSSIIICSLSAGLAFLLFFFLKPLNVFFIFILGVCDYSIFTFQEMFCWLDSTLFLPTLLQLPASLPQFSGFFYYAVSSLPSLIWKAPSALPSACVRLAFVLCVAAFPLCELNDFRACIVHISTSHHYRGPISCFISLLSEENQSNLSKN